MRLMHLTLRTTQPGRITSFYRAVLQLQVRSREEDRAVLVLADDQLLIVEGVTEDPGGGDQLWLRAGTNTLGRVRRRLLDLGAEVLEDLDQQVVFRDPDGRRVAVTTRQDFGGLDDEA